MEILSLGEKIKRKRKEQNMTLKDLAGDRITPGQISLVESGKSKPSMDLLEYLAASLNTTIEYLMETEESQAEKICLYYENIAEAYIINEEYNSSEQYIEKAIFYAEKYNLQYRKAKNFFSRAKVSEQRGEYGLAQQYYLSANGIFIKNNSYEDIVNTFIRLGSIALNLKSYHSAFSYFQQAEQIFTEHDVGNDFLLGEIYYYIAYTHSKLEDTEKAISYSYLAKEKFRQLDNKKEYAKSLLLLSKEYGQKGDLDNAIKYSKRTLNIFKEISDNAYVAEIENNLGKLFSEFQNIEESFVHLNKAREIRKQIKDDRLVDTLICICENFIKLKEINKSKEILNEIFDIVSSKNDESLIEYYLLKFRINTLEDNLKEAENTLLSALDYAKYNDYLKETAEISIMLGKFYIDTKKDKESARYLNEGVEAFKKLGVIKEM